MKLFRAITRDTVRDTFQQSDEVFQSEEQVGLWFQDLKTFHETWEDYYAEQSTSYARTQFPLVLVGVEEVILWQTF